MRVCFNAERYSPAPVLSASPADIEASLPNAHTVVDSPLAQPVAQLAAWLAAPSSAQLALQSLAVQQPVSSL